MAVTYGFFNSVNGDRKYNADQMSEYFSGIINEGVFQHLDGGLAVTAGTGLAVNVASGRAIIQNKWVQNDASLALDIDSASETYARKDAVVVRLDNSTRAISIAVKKGTPAATPEAPSMTRTSTTYEICLAYVNVAAAATSVTITDKRSDSTVCGWVTVAQATSGEVDAQLKAMKTGFDGVVYSSPVAMVQGCDKYIDFQAEEVQGAFDRTKSALTGETVSGKYMSHTGSETSMNNTSYLAISITADLVFRKLLVSGVAWYIEFPFVFVGTSGNIIYKNTDEPTAVTQYTDIEFTPKEVGTLYVNGYSGKVAAAYLTEIVSVKNSYLPQNMIVKNPINYTEVSFSKTSGKLLNANNGAITDSSVQDYYVSEYIDISNADKLMVSTEHFWAQGLYAFYDSAYNFISGVASADGGTVTILRNQIVDIPYGAKYFVIGFLRQQNFTDPYLYKSVSQAVNYSSIWDGLKWACIGDSLTESYGVTNIHYFEYIKAATGISTVNLGASGNGYAQGVNNFMTKALLVPNDSDVITIFGSGNDASSGKQLGTTSDTGTNTIAGCINTTIDNIYSILPVANLGIITPTPWINNMPYDNGFMENYSNLIVDICKRRSIPCLDLYHESNLDPNNESVRAIAYSKDSGGGVHPNEIGHKMIAAQVKTFLHKLIFT